MKRLLLGDRFVTLTGPGGTGKTRLALQVGAELLELFPDGVLAGGTCFAGRPAPGTAYDRRHAGCP